MQMPIEDLKHYSKHDEYDKDSQNECEGCKISGVHCLECPVMDAKVIKRIEDYGRKNTRASDEVIRGLVEALDNIVNMAHACNWERHTTGRQILLADAEKALAQAREYLGE